MALKKSNKSALSEKAGVSKGTEAHLAPLSQRRTLKRKKQNPNALAQRILDGNKSALAQGITLIESTQPNHQNDANSIIASCIPHSGKSIRIGITGVPGVGKSTFIESLGMLLLQQGKKVAVLAVDPSSSLSKGSILGDKTRMSELTKAEDAFVRPSPSGNSLGGVARKTRETIVLCEAAGYDVILIETVGVGQSETAVHSMVDFFLLLKLAGAGDQLQGIKRGIMEMADAIVINKADGDNLKPAQLARAEFERAFHLFPPKPNNWIPKVLVASALEDTGIRPIWELILEFWNHTQTNGHFNRNRDAQNKHWVIQTIEDRLIQDFYHSPGIKDGLQKTLLAVQNKETSPFAAAERLLEVFKTKK